MQVSDWVKDQALAVYKLIAEAESHAHGVPVGYVHFHEVGAVDAVADVVSFCLLMTGMLMNAASQWIGSKKSGK